MNAHVLYVYDNLSMNSSQTKAVQNTKTHILYSVTFFKIFSHITL